MMAKVHPLFGVIFCLAGSGRLRAQQVHQVLRRDDKRFTSSFGVAEVHKGHASAALQL